jgi:threonyl-tRNA synthetase
MLIVGEKDAAAGTVSVRERVGGELGAKPLAEVMELFTKEVVHRTMRLATT